MEIEIYKKDNNILQSTWAYPRNKGGNMGSHQCNYQIKRIKDKNYIFTSVEKSIWITQYLFILENKRLS